MSTSPHRRKTRWKNGLRAFALGTAGATILASGAGLGVSTAFADEQTPSADATSAAHGHALFLDALGFDVAGSGDSYKEFPGDGIADQNPLNLALLGLDVEVGSVEIPLLGNGTNGGLLYLGDLGAMGSYSNAQSATTAVSSSGLITADGAIDLDAASDENFEAARIDLTGLFSQLGITALTDEILDEASLELGALASRAQKNGTTLTDEYMLAGAKLNLHSQAIDGVTGAVDGVVGVAGSSLDTLVGPGGAVYTTVNTLVTGLDALSLPFVGGVNASLNGLSIDTTSLVDDVRLQLLQTPINNESAAGAGDESITIDLSTGTIAVDLEALLIGPTGPYAGLTLSTLPANTDVLSADLVNSIVSGITNALTGTGPNSLTSKVTSVVENGIYGLELDLDIQLGAELLGGDITDTTVVFQDTDGNPGTIGGLLGADDYPAAGLVIQDEGIFSGLLNPLLALVTGLLNPAVEAIGNLIQPVLDTAVTSLSTTINTLLEPLVTGLLGDEGALLKQVLDNLLTATINEQPTEPPTDAAGGDLGDESFTVRALAVELLPVLGGASVNLELGSSSVLAEDQAAALTASPNPVSQGGTVTLTGSGFAPDEDVTITLPDGTSTTVTANGAGEITATWNVPADYTPGAANFTALGVTSGLTANASTTVQADDPGDADANVNASASASASADADDDSNASAQVAAQAAALADATATGSAAADVTADAAADVAATATASDDASATSLAAAAASAQAAANSAADSDSEAAASAAADANPNAAASVAANATSSDDASATAAADASGTATTDPNAAATANADPSAAATASADPSAAASASADPAASAGAASEASGTATSAASASTSATASAAAAASGSSNSASASSAQASTGGSAKASGSLPITGGTPSGLIAGGVLLLLAGAAVTAIALRRRANAHR